MEGTTFWALAVLAAFCIGLSKGGAPAFGTLAVPIMALSISPVAAAGLLLPVFLFSDIFGVWAYRNHIHWGVVRIAVVGLLVGTAVGWATAHVVPERLVRVLIGLIGFVFALYLLTSRNGEVDPKTINKKAGWFWTSIAGFTSFVSHAGAPPWQVWVLPLGLPKMVFAGTTAVAFAIMNMLKVIPYYMLGQLQFESLKVTLVLFVPAFIGVMAAYQLVRVISVRVFYAIVTWMLLAVSVKLIWDGLTG
ncbi:sulfite exporter TauE/SafE family protein [Octadecabacter sp. CECT 8868]|uniref:sulfite exporter TauE/SafE family protein n=1 Tax=Octadecabacter algicola TaxID=2909342 RepID=UPI001F3FF14E|nr:sulfite exporter TauE/SafE family protein [Octadecabacter algicola]MCF2906607.1 sulfite exporter TauE/SafE family protein [Octadecabacter algicola]